MSEAGVFKAVKKNGSKYYRASITYRNKHISLGSYEDEDTATKAYSFARSLIKGTQTIEDYSSSCPLSFEKYVVLVNFRDNRVYIRNPIYLGKHFLGDIIAGAVLGLALGAMIYLCIRPLLRLTTK